MNLQAAQMMTKYRLFRPLKLPSPHYSRYSNDKKLLQAILDWTSRILLARQIHDLKTFSEAVFQTQTNILNRQAYIVPVWDGELARKIILEGTVKTKAVERRLRSLGDRIVFLGAVLVLKRFVFRGRKWYLRHHASKTGWFLEDRYHLDVYFADRDDVEQRWDPAHENTDRRMMEVFRVFHDSIALVKVPAWSVPANANRHNQSVLLNTPEYYPKVEDVIMTWHELAELLGLARTGLYGLCYFVADELEHGRHYLVGTSHFWGEVTGANGDVETDISMSTPPLWYQPTLPLRPELTNQYQRFFKRFGNTGSKVHVDVVAGTAKTKLFDSNLSAALIRMLLEKANGGAQYAGSGMFRVRAENATTLAAGTGNWGSGESQDLTIYQKGDEEDHPDSAGDGTAQGSGMTGFTVDLFRYSQKDKIATELQVCMNSATTAECIECANDSLGATYNDLGTVADFIDMVAGIAACVVATAFGHPWVCGITLPSAGSSAEEFWDETFGDYDYGEDICYGSNMGNGGAPDFFDRQCREVTLTGETILCTTNSGAFAICKQRRPTDDGWKLIAARCVRTHGSNDRVICKYCEPLVS